MGLVKFCMPNAYIFIFTRMSQRPPVTEIGDFKLIFGISTPENPPCRDFKIFEKLKCPQPRVISESVLWTELLGPFETVRENLTRYCSQRKKVRKKFSAFFSLLSLGRVFYRRPICDNGTLNVHKSPLTTESTTLGPIFGIRRQNSIRITLQLKKIFWSKMVNTLLIASSAPSQQSTQKNSSTPLSLDALVISGLTYSCFCSIINSKLSVFNSEMTFLSTYMTSMHFENC